MTDVSLFRLYLLRATYLLIAVGLGFEIWPVLLSHTKPFALMQGVVVSILATVSILAVVGIRHPLKMLPLLFFEMIWKAIWLVAIALPLWSANQLDANTMETVYACLMGILFPIVMPWPYVWSVYVKQPGDRWR
jgi:hypothetical protein